MKKSKLANIIIVFIIILTLVFLYAIAGNIFDDRVNDSFIKILTKFPQKAQQDNVVLVVIDDKSVDRLTWPWSRDNFVKIFDYLENKAGAKVIIFKNLVVFPDSYNPDSDKKFYDYISSGKNIINSYIPLNSNISGDVIPSGYIDIFDEKSNVKIRDERSIKFYSSYNGIVKLPKDFLLNVKVLASSVLPTDKDEYVRAYMPFVMYNDKFYPSLALSAYAMYKNTYEFVLNDKFLCSADNCKTLKMPLEYKQIKDNLGNKTSAFVTHINWKPLSDEYYSHKTFSAVDLIESFDKLQNKEIPVVSPDEFKDKIVIIGLNSSDKKLLQIHNTSVSDTHSDIDIHATMIDNMLSNSFKTVDDKDYTPIITTIFCFFILRGFKIFKVNLIFTAILSLLYLFYYVCEYMLGIYVPPVSPIITMFSATILKSLYSVLTTDKTAEMIKHAMGKYISKDVMNKVISNLDKLKLGGTRTVVTIFFVDIRNFTKISEELPPQEVTSILNEYFATIEPIIAKYHGIVNKYIGDGLLAVFGEPVKNDEHALNAVLCGIEIIDKVSLLREKFIKENKPVINIGIGVNTGEVFAGNIGTEERFEYTVIGDNVNLASRIESYNQILKTQFLISEYTYEHVKDRVDVVKLSGVNIKGKSKPIDIYEVLRLKIKR